MPLEARSSQQFVQAKNTFHDDIAALAKQVEFFDEPMNVSVLLN